MNVDINFRMDMSKIAKWDLIPKRTLKEALKAAAAAYMVNQRRLVGEGKDVNGKAFHAYSEVYRDKKSRAGRMNERYWLRLSGQMFRSQRVRYKSGSRYVSAVIAFEGMQAQTRFAKPSRRRKGERSSLTVQFSKREQVPSAFVAWVNDSGGTRPKRRRPFIGMSRKSFQYVMQEFFKVVKRG